MDRTNIFLDQTFWHHFQKQIQAQSWKCEFPTDILLDNLILDSKLYKDDTIFRQRRERIIPWIDNHHQWNRTLLGACHELATQRPSINSKILKNIHVLDALEDFVDHLQYFYMVASTMSAQGHSFQPVSQYSSKIHDLDKLDPIMLLGYSERFEDNVSTSVWDSCVERHVHVNPHHQAHAMWHNLSEEDTRHWEVEGTSFRQYSVGGTDWQHDVALCGHCGEDESAWGHYGKRGTARVHCDEGVTTWRHCDEGGTAWRHCDEEDATWKHNTKADALREMVCDKVSRRLQKTLHGVISDQMWDVEAVYFDGLPEKWMGKANNIMKVLKQSRVSLVL